MDVMYIADPFLYIRDDSISVQHTFSAWGEGGNGIFARVIQSDFFYAGIVRKIVSIFFFSTVKKLCG